MSRTLNVLSCGPGASLQDAGRFGLQRHGVSPAGAMDLAALALANALVGNALAAAAVELALAGARFAVAAANPDGVLVAAAGATLAIDSRKVPPATSALAMPGETISVGAPQTGVYTYLAVGGGFAMQPELGSLSLHRRSGIGSSALTAGAVLALNDSGTSVPLRLPIIPEPQDGPIRIMLGPQDDIAGAEAVRLLTSEAFTVSQAADRMGVRLEGPRLMPAGGFNIVSDGIATGTIQLPGDGRPAVLLRDRQTTGGYPKIATVISADLGRFAQLPPGSEVRFKAVSRAAAVAAARAEREAIAALPGQLVPVGAALSTELLLGVNLIDGVTRG